MEHSIFGASGAHRWVNCPASIKLSENIKQKRSVYAAEGTAAHALIEELFKGVDIDKIETIEDFKVNEDMRIAAKEYEKYVRKNCKENLLIEHRVDLSWLSDNKVPVFGTVDGVSWEDFGTLQVYDFKYGVKPVNPKENYQLMFYALGFLTKNGINYEDFEKIELHIVQPRAGGEKMWECSIDKLKKYAKLLREKINEALSENAEIKLGNHCFFCPAKNVCPEQRKKSLEIAQKEFSEIPQIPLDELVEIFKYKEIITNYLKGVEEFLTEQIEKGEIVKGVGIFDGRKTRKWANENGVINDLYNAFGEEIFEKKLKSPAQLEKIVDKETFEPYISYQVSKKLKITKKN